MKNNNLKPLCPVAPSKTSMSAIIAACFTCSSLFANLLIEDSFDYTVGSDLNGNGGIGFSSAWETTTPSGTTTTVTNGLSFENLASSGGAAFVSSTSQYTSLTGRTINAWGGDSGAEVWGSLLFQSVQAPVYGTTSAQGTTWDIRFKSQGGSTSEYRLLPFYGGSDSYNTATTGYDSTFASPSGSIDIYDGSNYLFISRVTGLGQSTGTIDLWIFDEVGYANALASGLTESALNNNVVANVHLSTGYSGTMYLSSGDYLQLANFTNVASLGENNTSSFIVDELRYGNTLLDVTPIPEPNTSPLLSGLVASGLLLAHRRRRLLCERIEK